MSEVLFHTHTGGDTPEEVPFDQHEVQTDDPREVRYRDRLAPMVRDLVAAAHEEGINILIVTEVSKSMNGEPVDYVVIASRMNDQAGAHLRGALEVAADEDAFLVSGDEVRAIRDLQRQALLARVLEARGPGGMVAH